MNWLSTTSMLAAEAVTNVAEKATKVAQAATESGGIDISAVIAFVAFLAIVITVSLSKSKNEKTGEDYFLAGRKLTWYLIGFSLIASNISTEQFVGQTSSAFGNWGMTVASYEWMSTIVLVMVALFFLPKFLKAGIYTMPEYLEYRYDKGARTTMAMFLMTLYVLAFLSSVLWSGATYLADYVELDKSFQAWFGFENTAAGLKDAGFWANWACVWAIALVGAAYTVFGGLSAVVWADLIQGSALLIGGCIITCIGLNIAGGEDGVLAGWNTIINDPDCKTKLDVIRPWNDPNMPWVAIFIGGLWIPNIFYWGLNQFITQRTLGAKSVHEGQKGILFAAFMKLLLPFAVCIPGIIAFYFINHYTLGGANGDMLSVSSNDKTYSSFMKFVLEGQGWVVGLMFGAITGAVMSSFNSGINSASTIYTMDFYKEYINKDASGEKLLKVGRIAAIGFVLFACLWAPMISLFDGVFKYIQEVWGLISPGIVAVFLGGMLFKRVPRKMGKIVLILGGIIYICLRGPVFVLNANPDFAAEGKWRDEKSRLVCEADYAQTKIDLINNKDFSTWLKAAEVLPLIEDDAIKAVTSNTTSILDAKADQSALLAKAVASVEAYDEAMKDETLTEKAKGDLKKMTLSVDEQAKLATAYLRVFAEEFNKSRSEADKERFPTLNNRALASVGMRFASDKLTKMGITTKTDLTPFLGDAGKALVAQVATGDATAINALAGYPASFPEWGYLFCTSFLHHMFVILVILLIIMFIASKVAPEKTEITMPVNDEIDTSIKPSIYLLSALAVIATVAVYIYFWMIAR
ncbi:MAG: sodium/solute symporter [Phycisphaerales bacterium]|jgi:solute:Na+ symporter, SSS family|nr:sodium/solute symporter [Phycisphaerales bacterium]MBT7170465.1 sodium/solute symporter [Phycisphaerales bacterium]